MLRTLPAFLVLTLTAFPAVADTFQPFTAEEIERLGVRVAETPSRELPGYRKLERVLVTAVPPEVLSALNAVAPDVEFTVAASSRGAGLRPGPYDAVVARNSSQLVIEFAEDAAWIHTYSAGVDRIVAIDWVRERRPMVTNSSGTAAVAIAEHAIALMMVHARQLHRYRDNQAQEIWDRSGTPTDPWLVTGRTMLVLGLGAIGSQIAERADALGMRVLAVRNSSREGPDFVEYVGLPHEMLELAGRADVVVNALPLTPDTRGIVDREFFAAMKPEATIINIGRGATIDIDDLITALEDGQIAGAGLDVTDPEPLPAGHPLWTTPGVVITPHVAGRASSRELSYRLLIDNVRRYQAGEPLLNPVDVTAGY